MKLAEFLEVNTAGPGTQNHVRANLAYVVHVHITNSVQIKWLSGRPDAQNCRRTTWTSQQVIRGTTRLTPPELELDFENLFHLFLRA